MIKIKCFLGLVPNPCIPPFPLFGLHSPCLPHNTFPSLFIMRKVYEMQQGMQQPWKGFNLMQDLVLGSPGTDGSSQLMTTLLHLGKILLWNELTTGGSCLAGPRYLSLQPFNLLATLPGLNHNLQLAWKSARGSNRMQAVVTLPLCCSEEEGELINWGFYQLWVRVQ